MRDQEYRPRTWLDRNIGPYKVDRYGAAFLAIFTVLCLLRAFGVIWFPS